MKDHKKLYGLYLRSSMLVSLAITILAFLFVPTIEIKPYEGSVDVIYRILPPEKFTPTELPEPEPQKRLRPEIVVPADPDDENAQVTIDRTDWDEKPGIKNVVKLEVVPYYQAQIQPRGIKTPPPEYPKLALQAGIEGTCVLEGVIDTTGNVIGVKIFRSSGNGLLDQAAVTAFRTYEFTRAYARDRAVAVWIRMPISFRIKE